MTLRHPLRTRPVSRAALAGALLVPGLVLAGISDATAADGPPDWVITEASTLGPLAIEPAKGDMVAPIEVTSAGSCPRGTHSITRMFGPKLPAHGVNVIGNSPIHLYGTPPADQMHAAFGITLEDVGQSQDPPVELEGTYRVVMNCQIKILTDASEAYNFYVGEIRIADRKYASLTTLKDLPKVPVATAGPEAIAYRDQALQGPIAADPTSAVASTEDSGGAATAVIVTIAITALGIGAVAIGTARSRSSRRTPTGSRR